uniref:Uncharacterized protein n=1 Tax=Romanomermis culicivorax TaxID=13658 RepID=A0A915HNW8_ROMCU
MEVQVDVSAKITYMERCDFWGKDFERRDGTVVRLYNIRDSSTCGLICLLAPEKIDGNDNAQTNASRQDDEEENYTNEENDHE